MPTQVNFLFGPHRTDKSLVRTSLRLTLSRPFPVLYFMQNWSRKTALDFNQRPLWNGIKEWDPCCLQTLAAFQGFSMDCSYGENSKLTWDQIGLRCQPSGPGVNRKSWEFWGQRRKLQQLDVWGQSREGPRKYLQGQMVFWGLLRWFQWYWSSGLYA